MARLRLWIVMCCWITAGALVMQLIVWSLATFTDLRESVVEPEVDQPLVVQGTVDPDAPIQPLVNLPVSVDAQDEPVIIRSKLDYLMQDATSLTVTIGTMSCLLLVPLVLVGMLVAASNPSSTIDKTISAWIWCIIVSVLALPLNGLIQLPWGDGALRSYPAMLSQISAWQDGQLPGGLFFSRFLFVPLLCSLGAFFVGWRFSRSIARMMPESEYYFDPELEREAGGVSATSQMNTGRAADALGRVMTPTGTTGPVNAMPTGNPAGVIKPDPVQPSQDPPPRRLI